MLITLAGATMAALFRQAQDDARVIDAAMFLLAFAGGAALPTLLVTFMKRGT